MSKPGQKPGGLQYKTAKSIIWNDIINEPELNKVAEKFDNLEKNIKLVEKIIVRMPDEKVSVSDEFLKLFGLK